MQLSEAKKILEERPNRWAIQQARAHQSKLRFHTDITLNRNEVGTAYYEFIGWVKQLLKQDKFNRFNELLQFPNPNNELTDAIYSELSKALTSEDYVETYIFTDDKAKADWEIYKEKFTKFWNTTGWDTYKRSINSFVVIDMPSIQLTDYPEASYFFVNIDNVIESKVTTDNQCEYLAFETDKGIVFYCDEYLRIFDDNGNIVNDENGNPYEIEHGLGECPARSFWTDTLNAKSNINKKAAISGTIGEMDWLLFHRVNKKYLDLGNSYPIIYEYEADVEDEEIGSDDKPTAIEGDTKNAGAEMAGAGSYKTVPAPDGKDDVDLMRKPIHTEKVDIDALNYNTSEQDRLTKMIFNSAVGFGGEPVNDSAKNEKQVQSAFESRENILRSISYNFASIKMWANDMVCRIRYEDRYVSNFIYGGSRFFLQSETTISENLNESDSDILKESLNEQLLEVRFKKDDQKKLRAKILSDIDPFAFRSNKEVIELAEKGLINLDQFLIKQKLFTFVKKFERENAPLTQFEASKPYNDRIKLIIKIIESYARSEPKPKVSD